MYVTVANGSRAKTVHHDECEVLFSKLKRALWEVLNMNSRYCKVAFLVKFFSSVEVNDSSQSA